MSWHSDIFFRKTKQIHHSLANKSNLKLRDFDLFKALPFRLATHIEQRTKSGYDSCYSMKQVLIWSQEYASFEGSSAGEWLSQVMEKIALTEKVLI